VLLWPVKGHIKYVSRILFKRIFLRDVRICSTRIDYMRRSEGGQQKNKKKIKNNYNVRGGKMRAAGAEGFSWVVDGESWILGRESWILGAPVR
jgi:hypothetical protein